jgi:hypothetical protein
MSILAMRHRFIGKDLVIMPVVQNSVVFKYLFERREAATQPMFSVHQAAMNLVFDKRHQDRDHNKPRKRLDGVLHHRQ